MRNLNQIFLTAVLVLLVSSALAETNTSPETSGQNQSPGFYDTNLGLVKKMLASNCFDPTSAIACMVRSSNECVSLVNAAFDACWPALKPHAPKEAGPEALKFNSQIAACVMPQFKRLVAESDSRIENYKVPCR